MSYSSLSSYGRVCRVFAVVVWLTTTITIVGCEGLFADLDELEYQGDHNSSPYSSDSNGDESNVSPSQACPGGEDPTPCGPGQECTCSLDECCFSCPDGECEISCATGSRCHVTCDGGNCDLMCAPFSECDFHCPQGCDATGAFGSECNLQCSGDCEGSGCS